MIKWRALKSGEVPAAGDLAIHVFRDLDGRLVDKVENETIWIRLPGGSTLPVPAINYEFKRAESKPDE